MFRKLTFVLLLSLTLSLVSGRHESKTQTQENHENESDGSQEESENEPETLNGAAQTSSYGGRGGGQYDSGYNSNAYSAPHAGPSDYAGTRPGVTGATFDDDNSYGRLQSHQHQPTGGARLQGNYGGVVGGGRVYSPSLSSGGGYANPAVQNYGGYQNPGYEGAGFGPQRGFYGGGPIYAGGNVGGFGGGDGGQFGYSPSPFGGGGFSGLPYTAEGGYPAGRHGPAYGNAAIGGYPGVQSFGQRGFGGPLPGQQQYSSYPGYAGQVGGNELGYGRNPNSQTYSGSGRALGSGYNSQY